jgi:hypothetical protein
MVGHTIQESGTVNSCKLYNRETFKADGNVAADVQTAVQEPLSGEELAGLPADFPALPPGVPDPRYGSYVIRPSMSRSFGVPITSRRKG